MCTPSVRRLAVLALGLPAACGSVTTYQSAEPLAPGRWQGAAALGVGAFGDAPQRTRTPTVNAEVGVRRGVGADTDVGLKLYTLGAEASARHRVAAGTWSWALLGALGGARTTDRASNALPNALLGQLRLGAVATRRTSPRWAFSFGPAVTGSVWLPEGGGSAHGVLVGGFGNADRTFGDKWHLVPELSVHRSVQGDVPVTGTVAQLGVALARDF